MFKSLRKQWLVLCLAVFIMEPVTGEPLQQLQIKRIAVLDLQGEGVSKTAAKTLTDRLRSRLVNTGAFQVLEREQMDEILKEQGFQQSGCVSDECLVEIGKLVGVEQMLGGSIGKIGRTYTLDLRIIDVSSGQILKTVSEDYQGDADGLLEVLKRAANKIASPDAHKVESGSSWYYWVGAGIVAAGVTALIIADDKKSTTKKDLPGLDGSIWPPPQN